MVVGPTMGGKSSNIRVLSSALTKLKARNVQGERYEKVKVYHVNPKSIKMGQLYGEFDENTVSNSVSRSRYSFIYIILHL